MPRKPAEPFDPEGLFLHSIESAEQLANHAMMDSFQYGRKAKTQEEFEKAVGLYDTAFQMRAFVVQLVNQYMEMYCGCDCEECSHGPEDPTVN